MKESDADYLSDEVYDIISSIRDPEMPHTLEELRVVDPDLVDVKVDPAANLVNVEITWVPTTPTCGLALNIALCLRTKLDMEFSEKTRAKIDIFVQEGKHNDKKAIDKQVNDKERVSAAMENVHIREVVLGLIQDKRF